MMRQACSPLMRNLMRIQTSTSRSLRFQPLLGGVGPMAAFTRTYRGHNRIEDMLTASEAWHALVPTRPLNDEQALRDAFARLDLDGSGKIDARELKEALLQMQHSFDPLEIPFGPALDAQVDTMMDWADLDNDGLIDFEEYKKVIAAGCSREGGRLIDEERKQGEQGEQREQHEKTQHKDVHISRPPTTDPSTIYL